MNHKFTIHIALLLFCCMTYLAPGSAQIISTIAGSGSGFSTGDGGPATDAGINEPRGILIDSAGNVYLTDLACNCVRMVNTAGIITTVAGNGSAGFSGDGGPATAASFNQPSALAIDGAGNLYIADWSNYCIRKLAPSGTISTFAGIGLSNGYSGDGGPATNATLSSPNAIAADKAGNVYIADDTYDVVRKVSGGIISTFAGNGMGGHSGDGGPATNARIAQPTALAVDNAGNVYIADSLTYISKVNVAGIITTIGGNGMGGHSGDGGPATAAGIFGVYGIVPDNKGNLFISDGGNNVIRLITASGVIYNYAGNHTAGYSGNGGPAGMAELNAPWGIARDSAGVLYIADFYNNRIRKITAPTAVKNISIASAGISMYPNPATAMLTISAAKKITCIAISNLVGQQVYSQQCGATQVQASVAGLPAGVYLVRVNGVVAGKFVKE